MSLSGGEDGPMERSETSPAPAIAYAGFRVRTAASLIDSVLMLIITAPLPLLVFIVPDETAVLVLSTVVSALVVILFWRWKQGTPGKLMLRLRIVDAGTGGEPGLRQWCLRYGGYILSTLPLLLGFLWIAWDPRHQGWHDKLAGTVVIRVPHRATGAGNAGAGPP
ncbi:MULTISPECIES: RDD family protein [unclassified Synechococcus]|uniref:RDD family protein n=1 Tax=unclassified Synechococcus TaxID=2626047 RepID=UPI001C238BF9|nr:MULTISPECIES: RDD family protein [unclassified Synechococcus]